MGPRLPHGGARGKRLTCVLAIANQKGGVGKTTTSINLAAALALKKKKTLLIDLDPQSNATIAFLIPHEIQTTMYDVFAEHPVDDGRRSSAPQRTLICSSLPARLALARLEQQLAGQFDAPYQAEGRAHSDSEGLRLHRYWIRRRRWAFSPSTRWWPPRTCWCRFRPPILRSRAPTICSRPTAASARGPIRDLKMLGVVITLFDKRTNISRDTHEQIRSVFGDALFKTRISKNVRLEESPAYKETIFTFAPKSSGAEEYRKLAQEVLQRVEEDRVARHSQDAA